MINYCWKLGTTNKGNKNREDFLCANNAKWPDMVSLRFQNGLQSGFSIQHFLANQHNTIDISCINFHLNYAINSTIENALMVMYRLDFASLL